MRKVIPSERWWECVGAMIDERWEYDGTGESMADDARACLEMRNVIAESCSGCGRVNTWHPDCPTCRELSRLEAEVEGLAYERDRLQKKLVAF